MTTVSSKTSDLHRALVCIHGITDSPFMFSDITQTLQSQPLLIHAPLLPGHGTVPEDLLHVTYAEWMNTVHHSIENLPSSIDTLFLAGFSLGASLALQAAEYASHTKGFIFFSPTFKIRSEHLLVLRLLRALKKKWVEKMEEKDFAKYGSLACNAAYQAYQCLQAIRPLKIKAGTSLPVFIAICENDFVSDVRTVLTFFKHNTHPHSRLLLYTSKSHTFNDPRIECRPNRYPDARIVSLSHVCMPIAPQNPHYGVEGDYKILISRKGKSAEFHFGERNHHKKLKGLLYRLTYNPDFAYMMSAVKEFMQKTS